MRHHFLAQLRESRRGAVTPDNTKEPARASMHALLAADQPILALAPMQDVTDLAFWRLVHAYGGADLYVT